jgi:large conductance mechanosensitive channel
MSIVKEFREFALRGNVLDLAVGVIIGAAFGRIINSMVEDVLLPLIGMAGKADFTNLYHPLNEEVRAAAASAAAAVPPIPFGLVEARKVGPVLAYGNFITITINFIIVAFCIFLVVKLFNTARRRFEAQPPPPAPAGPTKEQVLLTEIRDLLARR